MSEGTEVQLAEGNVFCVSPQGFRSHFKLTFPDTTILKNMSVLLQALAAAGWTPDRNVPSPNGPTEPQERQQRANNVTCAYCGGDVWDNREKKQKREGHFTAKSPDFACKDKDHCGASAWEKENGELRWAAAK